MYSLTRCNTATVYASKLYCDRFSGIRADFLFVVKEMVLVELVKLVRVVALVVLDGKVDLESASGWWGRR
jgi:hypothetical protein